MLTDESIPSFGGCQIRADVAVIRPLQEWDPIAGATKGILRWGWLAIRSFEIPVVRLR